MSKARIGLGILLTAAAAGCGLDGNGEIVKAARADDRVRAALAAMKSPEKGAPEVVTLTRLESAMGHNSNHLVIFRFRVVPSLYMSDGAEGEVAVAALVRYGVRGAAKGSGPSVELIDVKP
jgi:hypothetical protein